MRSGEAKSTTPTFVPRPSDSLAESATHADAVIGHLHVDSGQGYPRLDAGARQFVVVEAKMMSGLSAGTRRAPLFDQAARNVACIAELITNAGSAGLGLDRIAFVVIAPQSQITANVFRNLVTEAAIEENVRRRCMDAGYDGEKESWFTNSFGPVLRRMQSPQQPLSWEEVIEFISNRDEVAAVGMRDFLARCLMYNRPYRNQREAKYDSSSND